MRYDMPLAFRIDETSSKFFRPKTQSLVTKSVATADMSLKDNEQLTTTLGCGYAALG
jgi:hypothetical protein